MGSASPTLGPREGPSGGGDGTATLLGFPGGSDSKEPACNAGELGSVPGWERSPGGGHGNPLQCSGLENPIDRGAWRAIGHGVTKSQT